MYDLKTAQVNFAKLNLQKIEDTIKALANDRDQALKFARDPDAFLREVLDKEDCSPNLHCHVILAGGTFPEEDTAPSSSIVFRTHVTLDPAWRKDILGSIRNTPWVIPKPGVLAEEPGDPKTGPSPKPEPDPKPKPEPDPKPKGPPTEAECKGCGECIGAYIHFGNVLP